MYIYLISQFKKGHKSDYRVKALFKKLKLALKAAFNILIKSHNSKAEKNTILEVLCCFGLPDTIRSQPK